MARWVTCCSPLGGLTTHAYSLEGCLSKTAMQLRTVTSQSLKQKSGGGRGGGFTRLSLYCYQGILWVACHSPLYCLPQPYGISRNMCRICVMLCTCCTYILQLPKRGWLEHAPEQILLPKSYQDKVKQEHAYGTAVKGWGCYTQASPLQT